MTVVVLLPGDQLGGEAQVGTERLGLGAQQDLQLVLVDRGEDGRAGLAGVLAVVALLSQGVLASQRVGAHRHPRVPLAGREAGGVDRRLQADLAVGLDRAWGDAAQPRVDEQVGVAFHQQAPDPVRPGTPRWTARSGRPHHQHRGSLLRLHQHSSRSGGTGEVAPLAPLALTLWQDDGGSHRQNDQSCRSS